MALHIRHADKNDAPHVAALIDIAGHGIEGEFWQSSAGEELSAINAARRMIIEDGTLPYHYSKAHLCELEGEVAGGLIGGQIQEATVILADFPPYFAPLLELETHVPGFWAVIGIAVYPEFRGRGIASRLLEHAKSQAVMTGSKGLSLVVENNNETALALYRKFGFAEAGSRPWLSFAGRSGPTSWVLMTLPF